MGCQGSKVDIKCINFGEKYCLGTRIAKGSFGSVYEAAYRSPAVASNASKRFAVKKMTFTKCENSEEKVDVELRNAVIHEDKVWRSVGRHPNVVGLCESFAEDKCAYFVMERCVTSLLQDLTYALTMTASERISLFQGMLEGLDHIHSMGVVHLDIKPANVVFGGEDGRVPKICDFGLSQILPPDGFVRGVNGTAPFMSPEMLKSKKADDKTDVWSLGVTMYITLFGVYPYAPNASKACEMRAAIIEGLEPSYAPMPNVKTSHSPAVVDFVRCLLTRDRRTRPSANKALNLDYLRLRPEETDSNSTASVQKHHKFTHYSESTTSTRSGSRTSSCDN